MLTRSQMIKETYSRNKSQNTQEKCISVEVASAVKIVLVHN